MATFTFNSNTTISGTSNADLMLGTDTAGNTNDVVYGLQGDDTINATFSLSTSTLYGGQGNDVIYANNSNNVLYGNRGDDTLIIGESTNDSIYANNDTLYGGLGNDSIEMEGPGNGNVAYGGAGSNRFYLNEEFKSTVVGGLGNDHIFASNSSVLLLTAATRRAASTATTRSSSFSSPHRRPMGARAMTRCSAPRAPETPSTAAAATI